MRGNYEIQKLNFYNPEDVTAPDEALDVARRNVDSDGTGKQIKHLCDHHSQGYSRSFEANIIELCRVLRSAVSRYKSLYPFKELLEVGSRLENNAAMSIVLMFNWLKDIENFIVLRPPEEFDNVVMEREVSCNGNQPRYKVNFISVQIVYHLLIGITRLFYFTHWKYSYEFHE